MELMERLVVLAARADASAPPHEIGAMSRSGYGWIGRTSCIFRFSPPYIRFR
jgi:hypothetical protein